MKVYKALLFRHCTSREQAFNLIPFLGITQQAHELTQKKNGNNTSVLLPSSLVRRTGQMSNFFMRDFKGLCFLDITLR